jgi:hypothetical protein
MSNPINELLNRTIPEKLWHYTSIQGFQAIVASKSIWATDLHFLNDREEFIHARNVANGIAAASPELDSNGFPNKPLLEKAVALAFDSGPLAASQVFVASFSASEDQLGQWRGYSHGSTGVSLAFDLKAFRPPADSESLVSFAPCVYSTAEKKALVSHALRHFMEELGDKQAKAFKAACELNPGKRTAENKEQVLKEYYAANPSKKPPFEDFQAAVLKTRVDCMRITGLLKHSAFAEESEWRLVLPTLPKIPMKNPPRYRVEKTTLIPYIVHPFSAATPLPLVDIILGPGSDDRSVFAAKKFLESQGLDLTPRLSKVPYRAS